MVFSLITYSQSMEKTTLRSLFLLVVITGTIFTLTACDTEEKSVKNAQPIPATSVKVEPTTTPAVKVTTKHADGVYTLDAPYGTPGGDASITVSVTLKDDIVQSLNVVGNAKGGTIKSYQSLFVSGVNAEVIGKKLDSAKVGVVNGASLTSAAFNQAIASISAKL